jgi:hypothetical protein
MNLVAEVSKSPGGVSPEFKPRGTKKMKKKLAKHRMWASQLQRPGKTLCFSQATLMPLANGNKNSPGSRLLPANALQLLDRLEKSFST